MSTPRRRQRPSPQQHHGDGHWGPSHPRRSKPWNRAAARFSSYASKPPSLWRRMLYVLLLALVVRWIYDARGTGYAVVAAAFYGTLLLVVPSRLPETIAWSRRHPLLDSLVMFPAAFFALAAITDLTAPSMAAISVAVWLLTLGARRWTRRNQADRTTARSTPQTGTQRTP